MRALLLLILVAFQQPCLFAQPLEIKSPRGKIKLEFKIQDGLPYYKVYKGDQELIEWSELGLKLKDQAAGKSFEIINKATQSHLDVWRTLWEKSSSIKDEFNLLKTTLRGKQAPNEVLFIIFRVYDDGVAWRYELPKQSGIDSIIVERDLSSFNLAISGTCWAFNGERKNLGPSTISGMPDTLQTPFLYKAVFGMIAILEAEIKDMAYFNLQKSVSNVKSLSCLMPQSKVKTPAKTSWRVILIGDNEKQLIESNILVNLNPPTTIKDVSWIKPGKSTWNWRGWGYKTADGFEYKINTESQKRFIDFAATNNIQYHLIDANWYGPEFDKSSDPSVAKADFNMQEILAYAKKRKIGIFLYLNDVAAKKYGLERVLKQFHDWGAVGIKYGFMKGLGQEKVLFTSEVISLCAKIN